MYWPGALLIRSGYADVCSRKRPYAAGYAEYVPRSGRWSLGALELLRQVSMRLQGHLWRAEPDGPGREQRGWARTVEKRTTRVTRRRRPGFTHGLAVAGRQLSPRPSDASPSARRLPRGSPADRPPAVTAVSRCHARQHHG